MRLHRLSGRYCRQAPTGSGVSVTDRSLKVTGRHSLPTVAPAQMWRVKLSNFLVAVMPLSPVAVWALTQGPVTKGAWLFALTLLVLSSVVSPVALARFAMIYPYRRYVESVTGAEFSIWQAAFHRDSLVRPAIWGNVAASALVVTAFLI